MQEELRKTIIDDEWLTILSDLPEAPPVRFYIIAQLIDCLHNILKFETAELEKRKFDCISQTFEKILPNTLIPVEPFQQIALFLVEAAKLNLAEAFYSLASLIRTNKIIVTLDLLKEMNEDPSYLNTGAHIKANLFIWRAARLGHKKAIAELAQFTDVDVQNFIDEQFVTFLATSNTEAIPDSFFEFLIFNKNGILTRLLDNQPHFSQYMQKAFDQREDNALYYILHAQRGSMSRATHTNEATPNILMFGKTRSSQIVIELFNIKRSKFITLAGMFPATSQGEQPRLRSDSASSLASSAP